MALTWELKREICWRWACMTSRAESCFPRICLAISTARRKQRSEDGDGELGMAGSSFAGSKVINGDSDADTTALVPSCSTARRVILLGMDSSVGLWSCGETISPLAAET